MADIMNKVGRILISQQEIHEAIKKAGAAISAEYDGKPLLLVSILKGAFVFLADLCREITVPCEVDFITARSYYGGTSSSGSVEIVSGLERDISGYHVIIAEDIIDTGRTLSLIAEKIRGMSPLSLKIVTLLDKPERRETDLNADLSLFTIPDLFVIGYGLDMDERYRNLPYIAEYKGDTL